MTHTHHTPPCEVMIHYNLSDSEWDIKTSQHVTIDVHAARAAFNKTTLTKAEESRVFRVQGNIELQQAYKRAVFNN